MTTTRIFRQLYLFDCDGGRNGLFKDRTKLGKLPNNCELYLFWNNNDPIISGNLGQLQNNQQIHLCPSHRVNSKDSADGKLIYFLGKLVNEFSIITIVQGNDEIYKEVIEAVKHDFPTNKIVLHAVKEATSSEFDILMQKMREFNTEKQYIEDDYELIRGSLRLKSSFLKFHVSNKCPQCNKSFTNAMSTMSHLTAKHNLSSDNMCILTTNDTPFSVTPPKQKNNKPPMTLPDGKEPLRCSHPACSSKKKTFKKEEDLQEHKVIKH